MPAIHYVNRNESNDAQVSLSPRRCSQRKAVVSPLTPISNGKSKTTPKRNENVGWLAEENHNDGDTKKSDIKMIKRGKRSLTIEKDKVSPRSVKVLRRSHAQSSADIDTKPRKLHLPVVKHSNKTL